MAACNTVRTQRVAMQRSTIRSTTQHCAARHSTTPHDEHSHASQPIAAYTQQNVAQHAHTELSKLLMAGCSAVLGSSTSQSIEHYSRASQQDAAHRSASHIAAKHRNRTQQIHYRSASQQRVAAQCGASQHTIAVQHVELRHTPPRIKTHSSGGSWLAAYRQAVQGELEVWPEARPCKPQLSFAAETT